MASFWGGTGGAQIKRVVGQMQGQDSRGGIPGMPWQTGGPTTGQPGGATPGQPLGGPQIPGGGTTATPGAGVKRLPRFGPTTGGAPGMGGAPTGAGFPPMTGAPNTGNPGSQVYAGGMPPTTYPMTNQQTASTGSASSAANPWQSFTATNNLVGAQITPGNDPRLSAAQNMTDTQANALSSWNPKPFQSIGAQDTSATTGAWGNANTMLQGMSTAGYRPVANTDTSGAKSYLDMASQNIGPNAQTQALAGMGQTGSFGYGGDTGAVRGMSVDQLKQVLNTTPDRGKLAGDAYQLLLDREQPQAMAEDRALAQKTAAMGRRGSGMFNSEQMDLATARERTRDQARRELANNAASLSLSDAQAKLAAAQGLGSDLAGQDTAAGSLNLKFQNSNNAERGAAFGRGSALSGDTFNRARALSGDTLGLSQVGRNDALTERDAQNAAEQYGNTLTDRKATGLRQYGTDLYGIGRDARGDAVNERDTGNAYDQTMFSNRRGLLGDMSGYEGFLNNQGQANRNEWRTERGYQAGQDQQAIDNAVRQRQLEDSMYGTDANIANSIFGNAYSQNPYGALAGAAQNYGAQAGDAYGAMGDLFSSWAKSRAMQRPTTAASGG